MLRSSLLVALAVSTSLACSSSIADGAPASTGGTPDFQWKATLDRPTRFELHDLNGAVRAEATNDDVLSVVATKTGRRADFDKVTIVTKNEGGTVVVCALWPGQSSCPGSSSTGRNNHDVEVRVDFVVRLPAKVTRVALQTLNGAISATNVNAKDGTHLSTLNGRIDVVGRGPLEARTLNGRVELTLPNDADAEVEASTMHGKISNAFGDANRSSELGVPIRSRFKIGAGSVHVGLSTMNGDVVVRRGT